MFTLSETISRGVASRRTRLAPPRRPGPRWKNTESALSEFLRCPTDTTSPDRPLLGRRERSSPRSRRRGGPGQQKTDRRCLIEGDEEDGRKSRLLSRMSHEPTPYYAAESRCPRRRPRAGPTDPILEPDPSQSTWTFSRRPGHRAGHSLFDPGPILLGVSPGRKTISFKRRANSWRRERSHPKPGARWAERGRPFPKYRSPQIRTGNPTPPWLWGSHRRSDTSPSPSPPTSRSS